MKASLVILLATLAAVAPANAATVSLALRRASGKFVLPGREG
jgi:hypothetical protein